MHNNCIKLFPTKCQWFTFPAWKTIKTYFLFCFPLFSKWKIAPACIWKWQKYEFWKVINIHGEIKWQNRAVYYSNNNRQNALYCDHTNDTRLMWLIIPTCPWSQFKTQVLWLLCSTYALCEVFFKTEYMHNMAIKNRTMLDGTEKIPGWKRSWCCNQ